MLNFILSKINRKFIPPPQGFENKGQWKGVKVGDIVEYATQFSEGIQYMVEEIRETTQEARIRRINNEAGRPDETYLVPLGMLRPLSTKKR